MQTTNVFILFGMLLSAELVTTEKHERFTYLAKLLEKIIRMEKKMEGLEKEMKVAQFNVHSFIQNQTWILENKTAELELLGERPHLPLIAFNAYNPVDVSPDTNQIIIWQSTRLNEGNAYDTVIGIFKAPISGLYYFAVHACNYGGQTLYYGIVLEHNLIAQTYKYDKSVNDCDSISTITMVTAGQRVWVKSTSGSTNSQIWESSGRSSFTGALIHK